MVTDLSGPSRLITLVNTNRVQPPVAPIALDYLHEPLTAAGYEVDLLDLCFSPDWAADIATYASVRRPRWWGVTFRNSEDTCAWSGESFVDLVAAMIRALKAACPAPVILGGVGFSTMPEALLPALGGDYGIAGEGEVALPALLDRLSAGRVPDGLPGLVYQRDGAVVVCPPAARSTTGTLPVRRRLLVDNERYFAEGGLAGIETKRGCNRLCVHCVEPGAKGRQLRLRDVGAAVDEIAALAERGITAFHINDSEFNLSVRHAMEFCAELSRRGLPDKMRWYAYGMPAPFPDELAEAMVNAGCDGMNFGADSADARMLQVIRRTFTPADIATAIDTCRRHDLPHMVELLIGFPGETPDSVRSSIDFLRAANPALVMVSVGIRVFPGTELARMIQAEPATTGLSRQLLAGDDLRRPVFYVSPALGPDPIGLVRDVIDGDRRFFPPNGSVTNYNANHLLVEAIRGGERGAYWRILAERTMADAR